MSVSSVMSRVSSLVSFTSENISSNLVESRNNGDFSVDDESLRKIISIIEMSASQSLTLAAGDVEKALISFESEIKKSSKSPGSKRKKR